ncbi:TetR family transcriptional regulator C-terminal domain-containing protein [Kitasatospora sp. MAP5-34]|uniref:TetR/AcrR family transcriptional regulator n=1 Tax=Kitasatospora sp. MAP5-34 TaxID=3035102 RepID=UPI00247301C0|nr:TetR family transcriptional regulator C-terminal domain-containing protein [Kitasatospora sp. MAP5-34]MDH6578586.1 AcrR family transcriptional regulator [Kitasatospora sp. MAP5-34]
MPKQVDHEGRRHRIAEAVCLLADEHGLEGVTLRDVAARAQVSMGAVQRCFRTKEEMLVFALGHIGERITERVRARLAGSPAQSAGTTLGHAVTEIALLEEEHRAEARVWLAFVARAAVSEPLAATLKTNYAALQEAFARLVREAGANAEHAVPLDPQREARTLLALADGLTTHVLIGHLTPQEAADVLHAHLADLWARPSGPVAPA